MSHSAAYSILAAIVVGFVNFFLQGKRGDEEHEAQSAGKALASAGKRSFFSAVESLEAGSRGAITVAVACAMAGIIAGCITVTGLASILINAIVQLAGNATIIGLVLTMLCCIVLGMGVPTTANYCIMASTCAPILIQLGFPVVAAHFSVFYFGIVADITPPVALAAYAGSAIAKSNPMKTGLNATKLAIVTVDKLHTESWYQRSDKEDVLQSGLIFKRRGSSLYVLTQVSSLVEKGSLEVSFANGKSAAATLVATDDNLGIAVLRMDVNDISKSTMNQIYVIDFTQDASDTALELNDRVLLFGCPNGIMKSVMPGNVVNTDMTVQAVDDCLTVYVTDIAYTEGGDGFVSDIEGRMVGMTTDAYQRTTGDTNWAFISAEDIAVAAEAIVEEKTPVTFGIRGKDMENGKGIYVTEVLLKSPAYHGGVRVADVIDSIDGNKIRSMKDLSLCLSTHERGDRITVGLCRSCSGKQKKKSVKVELK